MEFYIFFSLYKFFINLKKYLIDIIMEECGRFNIYFLKRKLGFQKVVIRGRLDNIEKVKKKFY